MTKQYRTTFMVPVNDRWMETLTEQLNSAARNGWRLHSVVNMSGGKLFGGALVAVWEADAAVTTTTESGNGAEVGTRT